MNLHMSWRRALESLQAPGPAGWVGPLGLLLLLAALGWLLLVNRPLLARSAALQAELQTLSAESAAALPGAAEPGRAVAPSGAAQLTAFEARFPRLQELPQLLAHIEQGAAAQRMELPAGEYRLERRPEDRLLRYRITLPVRARYAQVRSLVDHVLLQLPTAALDDIELQRESADPSSLLQARLRFTLFLRP